jgi:hypothetical protein
MIKSYENFLSEKDFTYLQNRSDEIFNSGNYTLKTNHEFWDPYIVLDSSPVYVYGNPEEGKEISQIVGNHINTKYELHHAMFYYWTAGSHIPWHNDPEHAGGITIILNEYWDINHGGLFMFSDCDHQKDYKTLGSDIFCDDIKNSKIQSIIPKRNKAIEQIGGIYHSVSVLSKNAPLRKTLQIFYKKSS